MRNFDTIILHASATPPDWMAGKGAQAKRDEIDRWHRERGWKGIGYHFVVDRDGAVAKGRHINTTGAHVKGHNATSIGVCIVGGRWPDGQWGVRSDSFEDHFTPEQDRAVRALIEDLCERYPQIRHIKGHNDYTDAKGCPCFDVAQWLKGGSVRSVERPKPSQRDSTATAGGGWLAGLLRALTRFLTGGKA
jgi:hypothetical protein